MAQPQTPTKYRPNVTVMDFPKLSPGASPTPEQTPSHKHYEAGSEEREIAKHREDVSKAFKSSNAVNPASDGFDPARAEQLPPEMRAQLGKLQALMGNPMVQGYVKALSHPSLGKLGVELAKPETLKVLGSLELAWVFAILLLRAWHMGRVGGFLGRLGVNFYTTIVFWVVALLGVPWLVIGTPFSEFVSALLRG